MSRGIGKFQISITVNSLTIFLKKIPHIIPLHPTEKIILYNCVQYSINTAAKATRPDNELEDAINNKPETVTLKPSADRECYILMLSEQFAAKGRCHVSTTG